MLYASYAPLPPGIRIELTDEGNFLAHPESGYDLVGFGPTADEAVDALEEKIALCRLALYGIDEAW